MSELMQGIYTDGAGANFLMPFAVDIRTTASGIVQTENSSTGVTSVLYTFANGDTITDIFTKVTTGNTTVQSLTRGSLVAAPPPQTLSNFAVSTDGTKLSYAATGSTTALIGSISIAGVTRTLTHIISGVASISGSPISSAATGITVTINSAMPALANPISNVSVANNSTVVAGLQQTALTWSTTSGGTQSGDTITLAATGNGAIAAQTIDTTLPFELVVYTANAAASEAQVVYLDNDNTTDYTWAATNTFLLGAYNYAAAMHASGSGDSNVFSAPGKTYPLYTKIAKSGNDLVLSSSTDGVSYTIDYTQVGALSANPVAYIKTLLAAGSNKSEVVKLYR